MGTVMYMEDTISEAITVAIAPVIVTLVVLLATVLEVADMAAVGGIMVGVVDMAVGVIMVGVVDMAVGVIMVGVADMAVGVIMGKDGVADTTARIKLIRSTNIYYSGIAKNIYKYAKS